MNGNENNEDTRLETIRQIGNMSGLDFLLLLWEARIIGEDCVENSWGYRTKSVGKNR